MTSIPRRRVPRLRRWLGGIAWTLAFSVVGAGWVAAEELRWQPLARHLPIDGWRARLAIDSTGRGWLGGSLIERRSQNLVWRLDGEEVEPQPLPQPVARAYVLDVDTEDTLWLAAFDATDSSAYDQLQVVRRATHGFEATDPATPATWIVESIRPGLWPQAIAMATPDRGWVGGNHAQLLRRSNTGWHRTEVTLLPGTEAQDLNVLEIALTDRGRGFLVGSQGLVARLEGEVWQQLPTPGELAGHHLFGVDWTPDGNAWVVGSGGAIGRWREDFGWQIERPTTATLMAIDMLDEHEGWAVGGGGTILHYREGRWQAVRSPSDEDLLDIRMRDRQHGWIAGRFTILHGVVGPPSQWIENTPASLSKLPARALAAADVDRDGALDLVLGELSEIRALLRRPTGFETGSVLPRPFPTGLQASNGWALGDGDGDGRIDLLVLGADGGESQLYVHHEPGRWIPSTLATGLSSGIHHDRSTSWLDLDRDGDLDLYLEGEHPATSMATGDRVYTNDGIGRFTLQPTTSPALKAEKLVIWGDLDGDGDADAVFPSYYPGDTRLARNDDGVLRQISAHTALDVTTTNVTVGLVADLDLDGDLDLVLVGEQLEIHRNDSTDRGIALTQIASVDSGFAEARAIFCRPADLDLDGSLELLTHWRSVDGVSTKLVTRHPDGRFGLAGPSRFGSFASDLHGNDLGALHDALVADLDGDGDLDPLFAGHHGMVLFEGRGGDHQWLRVRLHGHRGTIIGTSVRVLSTGHGSSSTLVAHGHVSSASGVHGEVHLGLGEATDVDVEIIFPPPTQRRVIVHGIAARSTLDIHDTAMPWRLVVDSWRTMRRTFANPPARRRALVFAAIALGWLAAMWHFRRRRRSAQMFGPYRLGPMLGRGAMGVVYRARHAARGHEVALKRLHPHLLSDPAQRSRFRREARLLAQCHHPNLVRIEAAGEMNGVGFLAMELLEGHTLGHQIQTFGPLPPAAWREVALALANALSALHAAGIVHRDLKSENVFLLDQPSLPWGRRVRLLDLGLAWSRAHTDRSRTEALVGTLSTMAPERLHGARADERSDLWSLGVVLYHAATGGMPFAEADDGALIQAILSREPRPLEQADCRLDSRDAVLVMALLERPAHRRPSSARAVASALIGGSGWSSPAETSLVEPRRAEASEEPSTSQYPWSALYASARGHAAAGRYTEADVALVAGLRLARDHLAAAGLDASANRDTHHEIESMLDLSLRLGTPSAARRLILDQEPRDEPRRPSE